MKLFEICNKFLFSRQDSKQGASERPHEKGVAGLDGRAHEKARQQGSMAERTKRRSEGSMAERTKRRDSRVSNRACRRGPGITSERASERTPEELGSKQGVKWKVLIMRQIIKQGQQNFRCSFMISLIVSEFHFTLDFPLRHASAVGTKYSQFFCSTSYILGSLCGCVIHLRLIPSIRNFSALLVTFYARFRLRNTHLR